MLVHKTYTFFITLNMITENFDLSECRTFRQRNTKTTKEALLKVKLTFYTYNKSKTYKLAVA